MFTEVHSTPMGLLPPIVCILGIPLPVEKVHDLDLEDRRKMNSMRSGNSIAAAASKGRYALSAH